MRTEGRKHSKGPALPTSKGICSSPPSGDHGAASISAASLESERSQDALGRGQGTLGIAQRGHLCHTVMHRN